MVKFGQGLVLLLMSITMVWVEGGETGAASLASSEDPTLSAKASGGASASDSKLTPTASTTGVEALKKLDDDVLYGRMVPGTSDVTECNWKERLLSAKKAVEVAGVQLLSDVSEALSDSIRPGIQSPSMHWFSFAQGVQGEISKRLKELRPTS